MPKGYSYNPAHDISYELYVCPECKAEFYAVGRALHGRDCPVRDKGYDACIAVFGPKQVKRVMEKTAKYGDEQGSWYGLSIQVLREQFPHLLAWAGSPAPERAAGAEKDAA
jgi:hypothetical protein